MAEVDINSDSTLKNIKNRKVNMTQSNNRQIIRFVLDGVIRDTNITDVDTMVKALKALGVTLNTKDSDGNDLDEWTLSNDEEPKFDAIKLSQLSKKYNYTNDNVKKALSTSKLDPID